MGAVGLHAEPGAAGNLKQAMWNNAGNLRVPFVENRGQIPDPYVRFYARTFGGTVYVLQSGDVVYALPKRGAEIGASEVTAYSAGLAILKESFSDAPRPAPAGDRRIDSRVSCFLGNDPARWQSDLPAFETVTLGEIGEGIRLALRAHGNNVEKIFTVSPSADPFQIRVSLEGAESLTVNEQGELEAGTTLGVVRFSAPAAWQTDAAGRKVPVSIAYAVDDDAFGFAIGAYDPGRPLMIDPLLSSTFVGGSGGDYVYAVAVEGGTSNIIVAGATDSINFPTTSGAYSNGLSGGQDVFVSKFDYWLTNLIASTYLGGSTDDVANAIAIDGNGNIFVAGYTESANFPMIGAGYSNSYGGARDAFLVKFNSGLTPGVSTYLGGSGDDAANALAVDRGNNVFVAGYTYSANFPKAGAGYSTNFNGVQDGFVVRFNNTLSAPLLGATFLGGVSNDAINALVISGNTNAFVAGYTWSTNFPITPTNSVYTNAASTNLAGLCDAFVSRLSANLTNLDASTFLGGISRDVANAVALDRNTNVYAAGYTYSTNLAAVVVLTNCAQSNLAGACDAFLVRLPHSLTNVHYATYLGGSGEDKANGLALGVNVFPNTTSTNLIIVGYTASTNFLTTTNAYDRTSNGGEDAFVALINSTLKVFNAVTYLGGAGNDRGMAAAIALGSNSVIAVGYTASGDFPVSDAAYGTRHYGGTNDGFISRLASSLTYGTKKWDLTAGTIKSSPCMGPDGTLYVGSGDGYLYAISSEGSTRWTHAMTFVGSLYASPMITTNGIVYMGCDNAGTTLFALNATNGSVIYSNNFGEISSCPTVDTNGYIYANNYGTPLKFCRLTPDLTVVRTYLQWETYSSPALGTNNDLYTGATLGFFGFDTLSGATNVFVTNGLGNFVSSPAIGSNGLIYVGSSYSNVLAITPNGATNRIWPTAVSVWGSPVVGTNGVVYVGSDNRFYAFNPANPGATTTQMVWNLNNGAVQNAPALGADGTVYVGAGSSLYSLNPVTGATNWSFSFGGACLASSPLIGMDGTIYIGSADGKFYAVYGPTPPDMNAPWPKFHHDMMNSGRLGFDHRPRPPANVSATKGVYTNQVLVAWTPVPYATVYEIYRSTNDSVNTAVKIASTWRTNYLDNIDFAIGVMYHYWIKAKAPLGISGFSDSDAGGTLPLPPTGVYATKGEGGYTNSIRITWNSASGASSYQIWRSESNSTNTALRIGYPVTTNYEDEAITPGLRYYYWVKTTNVLGLSEFSVGDYGGTPPRPPAGLSAGKGTSVVYLPVTWNASSGADSYIVYSNVTDNTNSAVVATNTTGRALYSYGLTPCRHYYYWLKATNEFGISSYTESDWGFRALAPPSSISASDGEYSAKVLVTWVVGNAPDTSAHQVYRSLTNDAQTSSMRIETAYTDSTMTNYYDIEIVRGPLYYYWVRAKNAYGTSDYSQVDSGGTLPLPPTGISASDGTYEDKILVAWAASPYAATYNIYRSLDSFTAHATLIGTVSGNLTFYDDMLVNPGVLYYYWVLSVSPYGESVFGGIDSGWRVIAPPTTVTASDGTSTSCVSVVWSAVSNVSAYEVWRNTDTNSGTATKLTSEVTTNAYQDTAAVAGAVYYYWVKAKAASFTSGFSSYDSGYRAIGLVDIGVSDFIILPTVLAANSHPDAVSFRIENYGDQAMTEPNGAWVMSDFYLSANPVFGDADDVGFGAYSNSVPLSVRMSASVALTGTTRQLLTIPALPFGRYYIFVHVRHCLPSAWSDPVPGNNTALRLGQTVRISETKSAATVLSDYNGDGRADMAVYHEPDGRWYIRTAEGARIVYGDSWGEPGFQPVVGDYDNNGSADLAVYHEATGYWFIRSVAGDVVAWRQWWGSPDYQPVPGDYDGDRKSDLAVYHEADGCWYVESLAGERIAWAEWWGAPGYQAVPGDYDGDGKSDFAVYHKLDGYWYIRNLAGNTIAWALWWGGESYQAVPGDYDGDGVSDLAVYNETTGYWFIQSVAGERIAWGEFWGMPGYQPVPGDYDGDGIYDLAVYNEATGLWYIRTLAGVPIVMEASWGAPGYRPVSSLPE